MFVLDFQLDCDIFILLCCMSVIFHIQNCISRAEDHVFIYITECDNLIFFLRKYMSSTCNEIYTGIYSEGTME